MKPDLAALQTLSHENSADKGHPLLDKVAAITDHTKEMKSIIMIVEGWAEQGIATKKRTNGREEYHKCNLASQFKATQTPMGRARLGREAY